VTGRALLLASLLSLEAAAAGPVPLVMEKEPGLPPAAARLADAPHLWVADVMDLVGVQQPGPPIRVLLAPESSPLAKSAPSWVAGYTDGVSNVVVLLPERTPSYPDGGLEEVLAHEVAHVLIHRASGGRRIPRWFNEGVAMLAARSWRLRDQTYLALALLRAEKVPLWKLDDLFEGTGGRSSGPMPSPAPSCRTFWTGTGRAFRRPFSHAWRRASRSTRPFAGRPAPR